MTPSFRNHKHLRLNLSLKPFSFRTLRLAQVLKAAFGASLAIIAALALGLINAPSAGIVTLLTIQNTRRETLKLVVKRLLGFVLATILVWISFSLVGFDAWGFGLFVLLFVGLANLFRLEDAISMNAVLATHYLVWGRIDLNLILNEAGLLVLGMFIGILLNMAMPRSLPYIRSEQAKLDKQIADLCCCIAKRLRGEEIRIDFSSISRQMKHTQAQALELADNTWQHYSRYLAAYVEMRRQQILVLENIAEQMADQVEVLPQSLDMAYFLESIAREFHEDNDASGLLTDWENLRGDYRLQPLPLSRREFEQRAGLLRILEDLQYFLRLKAAFFLDWIDVEK